MHKSESYINADKLVSVCGFSRPSAESLARKLLAMPPQLLDAAVDFLENGHMRNFAIEGFTVRDLMRNHGFHYLNALNVIFWLKRDPDSARRALAEPVYLIKRGESS